MQFLMAKKGWAGEAGSTLQPGLEGEGRTPGAAELVRSPQGEESGVSLGFTTSAQGSGRFPDTNIS